MTSDIRNGQKMDLRAETMISQKHLIFLICLIHVTQLFKVFLEKVCLKIPQLRDLPESMARLIIERLKSRETQRSGVESVGVTCQGYGKVFMKHGTLDIGQNKVAHLLPFPVLRKNVISCHCPSNR